MITFTMSFLKSAFLGLLFGIVVSLVTIMMVRMLAKRAERYEPTFVPMVLVESKLWQWSFIVYPVFFAILGIVIWISKVLH